MINEMAKTLIVQKLGLKRLAAYGVGLSSTLNDGFYRNYPGVV
jgi:hypothetical protein